MNWRKVRKKYRKNHKLNYFLSEYPFAGAVHVQQLGSERPAPNVFYIKAPNIPDQSQRT